MSNFIKKGREAAQKELEINKKRQAAQMVKQIILKDAEETNIIVLDAEPVSVYIHRIQKRANSGKTYWGWVTCVADEDDPKSRCIFCEAGHKPSYMNAYPIVDRRVFEIIKDRNGKFQEVKITMTKRGGTFCVLLIGGNTIPIIERKYDKYSEQFTRIQWNYYRTGGGTDTTYHIEKSDLPILKKFGETKEEKALLKTFKVFKWEDFFILPSKAEISQILKVNGLLEASTPDEPDYEEDEEGEKVPSDVKF